ncbi:MAG TPA: hypothetical protein VHO28_06490 [Ignavibacteriales bacterium]|nr:hypothetical protein [Ignavibacteriales bacterium]HEX3072140.1 hypothetical protein [Ignavibacteriales bacterium]
MLALNNNALALKRLAAGIFIILLIGFIIASCKKEETVQPPIQYPCEEARFGFAQFTIQTHQIEGYEPVRCPEFWSINGSFSIGDTLAIIVSQTFNAGYKPVIDGKPVYVTITSKLGDSEKYLLKSKIWPCQTLIDNVEWLSEIIDYNTYQPNENHSPLHNNGLLEIRSSGDTLIASYKSYCSGNVLFDMINALSNK